MNEVWTIDGNDPTTGEPVIPPLDPADLAAIARGNPQGAKRYAELLQFAAPWLGGDTAEAAPAGLSAAELKAIDQRAKSGDFLGVLDGYDGASLSSSGWGIVFAKDDPLEPAIRAALSGLIAHRKDSAAKEKPGRFREDLVYVAGTTKPKWLASYNAGPGRVDPDVLPFYLLLVGDAAKIPWRFQSQLGIQHAVGRLHFDDIAGYKAYADAVLAAERDGVDKTSREALFFCPETDSALIRARTNLLDPLCTQAAEASWHTDGLFGEQATEKLLAERLRDAPARLLLTATHGASQTSLSTEAQRRLQGALSCAPKLDKSWLSGDAITDAMDLRGSLSVHTACFGAGTPRLDSFAQAVLKGKSISPKADAPTDLVAWLGQRMLARGSLAFVGHVDRTSSTSWMHWGDAAAVHNRGHFRDMLGRLLRGDPVGWALDPFGDWFAEKDSALRDLLEQDALGEEISDEDLAYAWLSAKDASGWVILGDPAVRVAG